MNRILLKHQWKYFWRSRGINKSIVTQIVIAFIVFYFLFVACFIGISLKPLLQEHYGSANTVAAFCSFILFYFAADIIFRFFWQELPTLAVQPYLLQNIRRGKLISFLNIRSLFTFINLLPFLLFIPFIITEISSKNGSLAAIVFAGSIFSLCAGNHFLILFIKRKTINSNWWLLGFISLLFVAGLLNYFHLFSIKKFSAFVFIHILYYPWLCFVPIIYAILSFYINSELIRNNFYFEETSMSSGRGIALQNNWLGKIAAKGSMIDLEIKSILRNKRPRSLLLVSFIGLLYGFLIFKKNMIDNGGLGIALFGATIVIGAFALNYGQFLFAWQSQYFDGLMANDINFKTYIKSKFRLISFICTVIFLLSTVYVFLDVRLIFILTASYLFCIGVLPIIAGYLAGFNYKGLDLSKASSFNWQGVGLSQWLYSFIILLSVLIIYLPFYFLHHVWLGVISIGITGLVNFLLQDWWINFLYKLFAKNKYKILEGFREK